MAWTGEERRENLELRRKVAELSMRLGISQRAAYQLIKDQQPRTPPA